MTNIPTLMAANENGISVKSGTLEVCLNVPLNALDQSWQFLDDLGERDYHTRIALGQGVTDENEFRLLLGVFWHLIQNGFLDNRTYEDVLEMAYYDGPFDDESALAERLKAVAEARAKAA